MMSRSLVAISTLVVALGGMAAGDEPKPKSKAKKLEMTEAVACKSITGYEDYEPLDEAVLTRDDKLLVYYSPTGFQYEAVDKQFRMHLVQDARIRRRGAKAVLQSKDKIVDFDEQRDQKFGGVYLSNTIALKALPPGEYDLEIILRDKIAKGPPVSQIMPFRIKASGDDKAKTKAAPAKE